jgi:enterochelin esterase-like enzyme
VRDVRSIEVGGGVQLPMTRLPGGDIWALSIRFRDASSASISIEFWVTTSTGFLRDTLSLREWRGSTAAPRALRASELRGQLRTDSLWSEGLGGWRRITFYRPPEAPERSPVIYLGDGQVVSDLAPMLDTLITVGQLPPVTLVGVWSATDPGASGTPAVDSRSVEYVAGVEFAPGVDSVAIVRRRQAHREFFVEHVRLWAERTLDVARTRELRAVWGVSNSAVFALTIVRDSPEVYGAVIAHSHGQSSLLSRPVGGWDSLPAHFVTVGALEQDRLHRVLASLSDSLQANRVPVTLRVLSSGHDAMTWGEALPAAVSWWLRK